MTTVRKLEQVTAMAALLSNPLRLAIVDRLRRGPCIVGDLVTEIGESQATLSKQLGLLREAGLLACRPDGRCRIYALASPDLAAAAVDALDNLGRQATRNAAECAATRNPSLPA
jgi:DNA-binding transcriptional ArsR family regulator